MGVTIDESRLARLLQVIITAAVGDYSVRVPLEEVEDPFLELEVGINYLLQELAERHAQNEAQRDQLIEGARQRAEQQAELVAALSTPIITVWRGVLALPLIGRIEDTRAATITAKLLEQVATQRASHVILDVTGVGELAPSTMPAILRMIQAIGLLGASCLVTGVQPEVARQLVAGSGSPIAVRALARLSDALALVLAEKRALGR